MTRLVSACVLWLLIAIVLVFEGWDTVRQWLRRRWPHRRPVRRYWGGPCDGSVCPPGQHYGIHCPGGAYRWDDTRDTYRWHQHIPPLKRAA